MYTRRLGLNKKSRKHELYVKKYKLNDMGCLSSSYMVVVLLIGIILAPFEANALSMSYYMMSCPFADLIVKNIINRALQSDPTLAAPLLRMHFHDCFIQGCDASILIDSTKDNTAEKDSPGNLSLRGYEVIDDIKQQLENQCPGVVSCADIIAMAARDAVFFSGGPIYEIPKGRKDGTRSKIEDTRNLPSPFLNSSQLITMFAQRGFTVQDVVALSGAHTLGVARCSSFKNRLSKFDSSHEVDPSLDSNFGKTLSSTCSAGDNAEQAFDMTKNMFDNNYFNILRNKAGLLTSDQTLYDVNPRTRAVVDAYALNPARFFFDFQRAMFKMSLLDVKQEPTGEVRSNCHRIN